MKRIGYLLLLVVASCLASCGGGEPVIVRPTTSKVTGALSGNFEVVVRDYKLSDGKLSVEFKRIAEGGPTDASWSSEPTFTVELLDEDGNSISSSTTSVVMDKEQLEAVFALGLDETATITFEFDDTKGAVKFKVTSKWDVKDSNETPTEPANDTVADDNSGSVSSGGSEDWDAILDSYEQYVTKYIALAKKATSGDMSAVAEYPALVEKAQQLGNQLENAQGSMSAAQLARYQKITQKMASAAAGM